MSSVEGSSEDLEEEVLELDLEWIQQSRINGPCILRSARKWNQKGFSAMTTETWLVAAAACTMIDAEEDQLPASSINHVVRRPLIDLWADGGSEELGLARGCVVSLNGIKDVVRQLKGSGAVVSTPAVGVNYADVNMTERMYRCENAAASGANEVEVLASPSHCGERNWGELYQETLAMRDACDGAELIVTLPTEELGTLSDIYKAALVCMMAGATMLQPTPLDDQNDRLSVGLAVVYAIKSYFKNTGIKVGLSLNRTRSAGEVLIWLSILKDNLGSAWATPDLFRVSGTALIDDLQLLWSNLKRGVPES
eukprot:m.337177 g.337177  ORF g.337177 m.337177 type:complete len:310 (-) comp18068_c0_seq1:70-999(-)